MRGLVWSVMLLVGLGLALNAQAVQRGDARAGEELATECIACHGEAGNNPMDPMYPKLAGQHYSYLVQMLRRYRAGEIDDPVMNQIAQDLSDREIRDLSEYFSRQDGDLYTPSLRSDRRR